jgi:hypothetical protein
MVWCEKMKKLMHNDIRANLLIEGQQLSVEVQASGWSSTCRGLASSHWKERVLFKARVELG